MVYYLILFLEKTLILPILYAMEETVTLEIPKPFIQVIYQALDIATKQVGLNGAEALLVVAKELAKQTGEQPDAVAPPAEPTEEGTTE